MTTETTSSMPSYMTKAIQSGLKGVTDWTKSAGNTVYGEKKGQSLYTDLAPQQQQAIGNTSWLANQDLDQMFGVNASRDLWNKYASAGPEHVQTWGVMNDQSPLGSFQSYMNPYLQQVLNPQLREIENAKLRNANQIGANATMSGAYGDARHGIAEGQNMKMANQAISDTVGKTTSDAFLNAQSARMNDLQRFLTGDLANQRSDQNAVERSGTAAKALEGLGQRSYDYFTGTNDQLFNAGTTVQANAEKKRAALQAFQEAMNNKDLNAAMKILTAATGVPHDTTTTTKATLDPLALLGAFL
jgi:hypothetical protein